MQTSTEFQIHAPVIEKMPRTALGSSYCDRAGRVWLIAPWFDALFVAGLAPWLLGLVAFILVSRRVVGDSPSAGPEEHALTILFVVASLLIGEAHQFTSIVRYFGGVKGRKKRYRWQRLPFWILYAVFFTFGSLVLANSMFPKLASELDAMSSLFSLIAQGFSFGQQIFPVVLMHHVCAQAQAVGLIYCGAQGYKLSRWEKTWLSATMWTLVAAGSMTIAAPFDINLDLLLVPQAIVTPVAAAFVVLSVFMFVRRGLRSKEWLPLGAAMLWINIATLILLPLPTMAYVWVFVPLLLHATQHWAVAWITQQREVQKNGTAPINLLQVVRDLGRLVIPVQALTLVVLFAPIWNAAGTAEPLTSTQFSTIGVGTSIFVFYIHYFSDRIVWRPQA